MSIKLKPLGDRILVKALPAEEKVGGIYIPDTAQEKPQKGKVVAIGPGNKENPITLKVGESIWYGKYSGTEITYEEIEYLIMRESDVLAKIS